MLPRIFTRIIYLHIVCVCVCGGGGGGGGSPSQAKWKSVSLASVCVLAYIFILSHVVELILILPVAADVMSDIVIKGLVEFCLVEEPIIKGL